MLKNKKIDKILFSLAFTIDYEETIKSGHTTIRLSKKQHELEYPSLTAAEWKKLASNPYAQQGLQQLLKEEAAYQQKITGRAPYFETQILGPLHISPAQTVPLLQILNSTGHLYYNQKALVVDFVSKVEFYYEIIGKGSQIEIKPHLKWRENDIDLHACDCIGPGKPAWFIKGVSLKGISTPLTWKELLRARQTTPWILEGAAKQAFLEEYEDDPDAPKIVFQGLTVQEMQTLPYPLLKLQDRTGAFATLWMDYGPGLQVNMQDQKPLLHAEGLQIKRQWEAEKNWEKDLFETNFSKKNVGASQYYCPLDKVAKSLSFLLEVGWKIFDWQGKRVVKQEEIDLHIHEACNALTIQGKIIYEKHEANLANVVGAFNRRERFISLDEGTVGLLPDLNRDSPLQELLEEGEVVGEEINVRKNRFGSLSHTFEIAHVAPSLTSLQEKWQNFEGIQKSDPGPLFNGTLRPYQQEGLNWLSFLKAYGFHGILADEMGLGKTVQVLALLSTLPKERHLIVMPTSLLFNWRCEIERFLPGMSCLVHQGPLRPKTVEGLRNYPIILTSYATLRNDLPLFLQDSYFSLILDEAQMIKNAHTQTFQAVCSLPSSLRLCLTGTPVENHMGELWAHFRFLIPDLFGSEESFLASVQAGAVDKRHLERIQKKIAPFIMRRRKSSVAKDLPPRIDQTVWIEMGETEKSLYEQFLAKFRSGLLKKVELEGMGKHRLEVLEAILRLRQFCCHSALVSSLIEEEDNPFSAKFDALMQDLETLVEEGQKVLIYSQFTSMLQLMTSYAKNRGWQHGYLDGSTINREKVVQAFQNDPQQLLFFVSLKAGGVGLNLTAADYVLLYDPWWNEAVEEQAINRAHRIGREEKVFAKRYIVRESIEEKMMKLKAAKREVVESLFEGDGPTQITLDDLRYLLE